MSIGQNIKRLRLHYGLSQKDLAMIAGVKHTTVSAWENNRIDPRMGAIQKIADHFGIKKSEIIEMVTDRTTDDEKKLLDGYRALNNLNQQNLMNVMSAFLAQQSMPPPTLTV